MVMRKLFGQKTPKSAKTPQGAREIANPAVPTQTDGGFVHVQSPHPIADRHSTIRASLDEQWDTGTATSDGTSPLLNPHSVRAESPYKLAPPPPSKPNSVKDQVSRKKQASPQNTSAALGILRSLDPHAVPPPDVLQRQYSEDNGTEHSFNGREREDRRERKGFWERATERTKERERERERQKEKERKEDQEQNDLTRMIGYLTATSSEDWSIVLEVCERASSSEANAKEASKALRKEFKYAEPTAQLSAARLWAIMIRNCHDNFLAQCSSKKFLDTLEDVLQSHKTTPVVRERILEVLAGAAYSCPRGKDVRHERDGLRGLWRKVKAPDQPDEGIPFDTDDAMFNPPVVPKHVQHPTQPEQTPPGTPTPNQPQRPPHSKHKSSRPKVIPPDEDIRRLLEECQFGITNSELLSGALAFAKPEDLKEKKIIKEFYAKCRQSQELIYSQLNWAYANAERSREAAHRHSPKQPRVRSSGDALQRSNSVEEPAQLTREEELLAALLHSNEQLTEALRMYDDLERVGIEREAEERSKQETRIDRSRIYYDQDGQVHLEPPQPVYGGSSHSPSPAPSPSPSPTPSGMAGQINSNHHSSHKPAPLPTHINNSYSHHPHISSPSLAPPPPAPHGPRLPTHSQATRSRTPSPDHSSIAHSNYQYDRYQDATLAQATARMRMNDDSSSLPEESEDDYEHEAPHKPSAKALGKRRQVDVDDSEAFDPDDLFMEHTNDSRANDMSDDDSDESRAWNHPQPIHYVYDAAAERTKERLAAAHLKAQMASVVPG